ncbi:MAG: hypothetical protein HZA91_15950 [Verrucomicrobia bacterium]|nr:hypothetical protein [Verrucomicrobiota bacterium]
MNEPPQTETRPTYEGARFPWWLVCIWLVFLAFFAIYHVIYAFPDLEAWLSNASAQVWK